MLARIVRSVTLSARWAREARLSCFLEISFQRSRDGKLKISLYGTSDSSCCMKLFSHCSFDSSAVSIVL